MKRKAGTVLFLPLVFILSVAMLISPLQVSASGKGQQSLTRHFKLLFGHASPGAYRPAPVHHALKAHAQFSWSKKHLAHVPKHRSALSANSGGNLVYNGGPVMENTAQVYAIFWEPAGTTVSASYNDLLTRYFQDVGNSPLYANNQQYTDSTGQAPTSSVLAGAIVDSNPYPSSTLFDSDIQGQVTAVQSALGWSPSITNTFMVYTASGAIICFDSTNCSGPGGQFCAYHSDFGDVNSPSIYSAMPYDGDNLASCYGLTTSPNNDPSADAEISTSSHEQMESATDPVPPNGWYDSTGVPGSTEIGDKCAYVYGPLDATGANVNWNGNPYVVQSEWDNFQTGCVLSGP